MNKVCSKCKESKSLDQFYRSRTGKYSVTSYCKECFKKVSREYNNKNKDRDKDKRSKYMKEYQNNNRDKISKHNKKYRKTEKGKLMRRINSQNRHYRKKYNTNSGDKLTKENIKYLTEVYKQCAYCNTELTSENTQIDHIHPLSKEGSHSIDNVVLACKECNLQKSSKPLDQWLDETGYSISIKHLVFMRLQET
jgi:5-methylcytosine-specific restriction endonuclease McrA